MIVGFILNIVYIAVDWAIHLLPVFDIPSGIIDAFDLIWSYVISFSFMTPIGAIQGALALVMFGTLIEVGIYVFMRLFGGLRGVRIH